MGLPEIVGVARELAVLVRVQGPDPQGLKMRKHAFHQYQSGITTLSASGMVLPVALCNIGLARQVLGVADWRGPLVLTVASVVEPFLTLQHRENRSKDQPELVSGAHIDILIEDNMRVYKDTEESDGEVPSWLAAQLLALVDVPCSSLAVQSLIESSSGSMEHGWEIGWSLASNDDSSQGFTRTQIEKHMAHESVSPSLMGNALTKIAVLGLPRFPKNIPNIAVSNSVKRGDFLLAAGSPFGILSPLHFVNSISVGAVANTYPNSSNRSLLMADVRCLPGMEGGPVFDEDAALIGILVRPLRQRASGAEVQLLIPWEAIATACSFVLRMEQKKAGTESYHNLQNSNSQGKAISYNGYDSYQLAGPVNSIVNSSSTAPLSMFEKAMASVCLVTVNDIAWASGVLLNGQGLIMTNAHLLEPWRFGKTTLNGVENGRNILFSVSDYFLCPRPCSSDIKLENLDMEPSKSGLGEHFAEKFRRNDSSSLYSSHKKIRVCLGHARPRIWYDAKVVYISKGPLDVALLQLVNSLDQLFPVTVDFTSPPLGSKAYVIGHGLFGPRCGLSASVSVGVVSKVVKAKFLHTSLSTIQCDRGVTAAMLETTAAVHPGASGGLVVNSHGCMIGLITSNARHVGGTVIPHLNFSIPSEALAPIFKFSQDMQDRTPLRDLDQLSEEVSSIWALMPSLSPKPGPSLPGLPPSLLQDDKKEGKGSRFAKFIAENEMFQSSNRDGKGGMLPSETIRSKL